MFVRLIKQWKAYSPGIVLDVTPGVADVLLNIRKVAVEHAEETVAPKKRKRVTKDE